MDCPDRLDGVEAPRDGGHARLLARTGPDGVAGSG